LKFLIDISNILCAGYLSKHDDYIRNFSLEDLENAVREYTLYRIFGFMYYLKAKQDDIIICLDYGSWRYDFFPEYKWKRKQSKSKSKVDFDIMYKFFKKFEKELTDFFPFKTIKVHKAEADDIIGCLAKHIEKTGEDVLICSLDKDFVQLTSDKVRLYDIGKNTIVKEIKLGSKDIIIPITTAKDAKKYLLFQIMYGDSCDGICNVKSDNDAFSNPTKQQKRFGPKTIMKHIFSEDKKQNKENLKKIYDEYSENMKRNAKLIDLKYTPKEIKKEIIKQYEESKKSISIKKIHNYCEQHDLRDLIEKVNKFLYEDIGIDFV